MYPDNIQLCSDELPTFRKTKVVSKYQSLFEEMLKTGQAAKCQGGNLHAPRLAVALRKLAENRNIKCQVKHTTNYGDGFGRVWIIKEVKSNEPKTNWVGGNPFKKAA